MRVLLVLLLLPGAAAQWSDPAGDHEVGLTAAYVDREAQVVWQQAPEGRFPEGDVLQVTWAESEATITLGIEVAALRDPDQSRSLDHLLTFDHHGVRHGILLRQSDAGDKAYWGPYYDPWYGGPSVSTSVSAPLEIDGTLLRATFEKQSLLDAERIPLRPGDTLGDVRLESARGGAVPRLCPDLRAQVGFILFPCDDQYRDPVAVDDIKIEMAPPGQGHLLLDSLRPLRLSNGLATTYVLNVSLLNLGGHQEDVALHVEDVPEGWDILLPERVHLVEQAQIPLAVAVPFQHAHGSAQTFRLVATSTEVPGVEADIELGVLWTEVPQPTRHHPDLYLHNSAFFWGSMDTIPGESEPTMSSGGGGSCCEPDPDGPYEVQREWTYRLDDLGVGLQFEPGQIVGSVEIEADRAIRGEALATLEAGHGGETTRLATMAPVAIDWDAGVHVLDLVLDVEQARLLFRGGQDLALNIQLRGAALPVPSTVPDAQRPDTFHLLPGASIRLPLGEYHDIDAGLAAGGLRLEGPTIIEGNAGETVLWRLALASDVVRDVGLDTLSPIEATVAPATVRAAGMLDVVVRIDVPPDAVATQRLPVMVAAFGADALAVAAAEVVVVDADVPDAADEAGAALAEAERHARSEQSPGAMWAVAAVAGVAALRRRG